MLEKDQLGVGQAKIILRELPGGKTTRMETGPLGPRLCAEMEPACISPATMLAAITLEVIKFVVTDNHNTRARARAPQLYQTFHWKADNFDQCKCGVELKAFAQNIE